MLILLIFVTFCYQLSQCKGPQGCGVCCTHPSSMPGVLRLPGQRPLGGDECGGVIRGVATRHHPTTGSHTSVQPLEWTFSTIVNGYNAHPVFSEMYEFTVAVSQGSLNHGRRVLLSIMCLLASRTQSNLGHWQAAYESLLFPVGVMLLDCAGCNKTYMLTLHPNAVFGTCVG